MIEISKIAHFRRGVERLKWKPQLSFPNFQASGETAISVLLTITDTIGTGLGWMRYDFKSRSDI